MENIVWLIGGFLLGWVLEWLIDFFYWRRPSDQGESRQLALEAARGRNEALESEKRQLQALVEDHAALLGERDALVAELAAARAAPPPQPAAAQSDHVESAGALAQAQADIARLERELAAKSDAVAVALGGQTRFAGGAGETLVAGPVTPDDLTRIKGIGPKIQGLLREAGLQTFAQLAQAGVGQLEAVLEQAGERFNLAVPETWPAQAILAAREEWPALSALQAQIQVGRRSDDESDSA